MKNARLLVVCGWLTIVSIAFAQTSQSPNPNALEPLSAAIRGGDTARVERSPGRGDAADACGGVRLSRHDGSPARQGR